MSNPRVLVVIVNWNHGKFLRECLDALQNQDYSALQIIIIDNGSTDGSAELVRREYPDVQLHYLTENIGFSRAFNRAARSTDDPFVLSLNPDVTARPEFITELVAAIIQDERIGIAAPKLLRADEPTCLDSTGLFINRTRRPYDRGQGELDQDQYNCEIDVFGACGAAALYRRAMLEDTSIEDEFFDEDFIAYYEDADLSWRAQLNGWSVIYTPGAVGTHIRGWGDTLSKQRRKDALGPRLALRNRYLMTIKNDSLCGFIYDLPAIIAAELPRLVYTVFVYPKALLGLWDFVKLYPSAQRKRKYIQKKRTVDANVIRRRYMLC